MPTNYPLNPPLSNCFARTEARKRRLMRETVNKRRADPQYDAMMQAMAELPPGAMAEDPQWQCLRHGHRGRFHKDAKYMDGGALMTVRDEKLIGKPHRDTQALERARRSNPKRVNKEDYYSQGVFPPPMEVEPKCNISQAENIVERRRHHRFSNGIIHTSRTARKQYPGPERKPPSDSDFWSKGLIPPQHEQQGAGSPKHLNAAREVNIGQQSKARTFGVNGIIMTYRRGEEEATGRSTLRNGRSSEALEDLQRQRDKLKAELTKLALEEELADVDRRLREVTSRAAA